MFWIYLTLLYLSCFFIFIGKAIADIVSNKTHWNLSVFSKNNDEDSFWGHKDATWVRKDHDNFILNMLFHGILVFLTDIWHFANFIRRIGIYLSVIFGIMVGIYLSFNILTIFLIISVYVCLNIFGFWIFYHIVLRKG